MNKNEKLLEAIGMIDDHLIMEAQNAGKTAQTPIVSINDRKKASVLRQKKHRIQKAAVLRFQGALAACAVLAICFGIYGMLSGGSLLISPFSGKEKAAEYARITTESTTDMAAAVTEDAAQVPDASNKASEAKSVRETGSGTAIPEVLVEEAAEEEASDTSSFTAESSVQESVKAESAAEEPADSGAAAQKESGNTGEEPIQEAQTKSICVEAETEAVSGETELALLQEPMVLSLRGTDSVSVEEGAEKEQISGNETTASQETAVVKLEVKLLKAAGTEVTLGYSNLYNEEIVTYGSMYELEQQTAKGWLKVPVLDGIAWVDILYELEPGKTAKETIRLTTMFGELPTGHYRLVKNCMVDHADQTQEEIVIYTEFDIIK